jgi:sugar phosphate isomerase/epimerase
MKLGFLTACLPDLQLQELANWAAQAGFDSLEIAAWPDIRVRDREHTACHLDVVALDKIRADQILMSLTKRALTISALGYYENILHGDPEQRAAIHQHLRACIDAAELLGVDCVGTFVGRDIGRTVDENLIVAEQVLPPLVDYAGERGVRLVIENCPMTGWHPDGYPGNLAYSPELWEWMFEFGLYLNFDPSHLLWLGIDPVAAAREYGDRVVHVQAKDVRIDNRMRAHYSIFGRVVDHVDPWDTGWWSYCLPGQGDVDWSNLFGALRAHKYEGTVSIEHEDPGCGGAETAIKLGLESSLKTLRSFLIS